jgi:hypothetical protein
MKPRVFKLEPTILDSSKSDRFGETVLVFPRHRYPSIASQAFQDEILERLLTLGFDPTRDYVLIGGPTVALALFVSAVAVNYGHYNALVFDPRDHVRDYEAVPVNGVAV